MPQTLKELLWEVKVLFSALTSTFNLFCCCCRFTSLRGEKKYCHSLHTSLLLKFNNMHIYVPQFKWELPIHKASNYILDLCSSHNVISREKLWFCESLILHQQHMKCRGDSDKIIPGNRPACPQIHHHDNWTDQNPLIQSGATCSKVLFAKGALWEYFWMFEEGEFQGKRWPKQA